MYSARHSFGYEICIQFEISEEFAQKFVESWEKIKFYVVRGEGVEKIDINPYAERTTYASWRSWGKLNGISPNIKQPNKYILLGNKM